MLIVCQTGSGPGAFAIRDTHNGAVVLSGFDSESEAQAVIDDVQQLAKLDLPCEQRVKASHLPKTNNVLLFGAPLRRFAARLWRSDEGQDLTEYALLMALIALGAIAAMHTVATTINNTFSNAAAAVGGATSGGS